MTQPDLKKIEKEAGESNFSGSISIYRGNEEVFHESYGYRNIAEKLPVTKNTLFGIASGTKIFTALGILTLVQKGELGLDSLVTEVMGRNFSFIDNKATIRQLLNHSSGIYDYYDEDIIEDFDNFKVEIPWSELTTPSDYLPLMEGKQPKFKPGSKCSYSNGGYVFLGMIIEKITGKLYRDHILEMVLKPSGMKRSGFHAFNDLPEDTALGYMEIEGQLISNIYQLPVRGASDGGMYTSAGDLGKFWNSLFNGEIISETLLSEMCRPHRRIWDSVDYGLGIYKWNLEGKEAYFITGSDGGVGFSSRYISDDKLNINILSNRTDGNVHMADVIFRNK